MKPPRHPRPSLVIFDCDGVLVDTEGPQNVLLARLLSERGLELDGEACRRRFAGNSMTTVQALAEAEIGRPLGEDFIACVVEETTRLFRDGVATVPGAGNVVDAVDAAGIAKCIASSGRPEKMAVTLGASGFGARFRPHVFDASMVAHGKPAPDLFLHAAARMGHAPERCVVIEDSLNGVAAGMRVIGYAGDPHTDGAALARAGAETVSDMRTVPGLIGLA